MQAKMFSWFCLLGGLILITACQNQSAETKTSETTEDSKEIKIKVSN